MGEVERWVRMRGWLCTLFELHTSFLIHTHVCVGKEKDQLHLNGEDEERKGRKEREREREREKAVGQDGRGSGFIHSSDGRFHVLCFVSKFP
jgi:hypothetical protein